MEIRSQPSNENYRSNWELIFGKKELPIIPLPIIDLSTSWTTGKTILEINAIYAEARETNTAVGEVVRTGTWKKRLEVESEELGFNGDDHSIKEIVVEEETVVKER